MNKEMKKWYDEKLVDEVVAELLEEVKGELDELEISGQNLPLRAYYQGKIDAYTGKKDNKKRDEIKEAFYEMNDIPSYLEMKDISRNFGAGMKNGKSELGNVLANRSEY